MLVEHQLSRLFIIYHFLPWLFSCVELNQETLAKPMDEANVLWLYAELCGYIVFVYFSGEPDYFDYIKKELSEPKSSRLWNLNF